MSPVFIIIRVKTDIMGLWDQVQLKQVILGQGEKELFRASQKAYTSLHYLQKN